MASRKVPPEVQKVFDKYITNFVRRLNKDTALEMLRKEFSLSPERAELMFELFDKDRDGKLSAWEFYLFYTCFGYRTNEYLDKFNSLVEDPDKQTVDAAGTWDFLKDLKTLSGRCLDDEELLTCMKAIAGEEDRSIDQTKFIELICRIHLTRG